MKKLITLFSLLLLCACSQATKLDFKNTDITGLEYANGFSMPDFNGKMRHLSDFKGKVVVMFFGYTQCPDVCPTTMAELSTVMKQLGPQADQVQVLFVTLDPARDTPAVLAQYVPNFDKRFLGLVGDEAATKKIASDFKIFYEKESNCNDHHHEPLPGAEVCGSPHSHRRLDHARLHLSRSPIETIVVCVSCRS